MPVPLQGQIPLAPACDRAQEGISFCTLRLSPQRRLSVRHNYAPATGKLALASRKADWINNMAAGGINVCERDDFARQHGILRVKMNRTFCPWFGHAAVKALYWGSYSEGISPFNYGVVEQPPTPIWWSANSILSGTLSLGPTNPCFPDHGGCTTWSCSFTLRLIFDQNGDPTDQIHFQGRLLSGGYDFLTGMPVVQDRYISCSQFVGGQAVGVYWTGVGPFIGPIGLVRSIQVFVAGTSEFQR